MVDRREWPPAWTLAEVRRTTEVMGSPPIRPRQDIAHALRPQLAIGGRDPSVRIDPIRRLKRQQGFDARDHGEGNCHRPEIGVREGSHLREGELVEEIPEGAHGQIDEMLPLADVEGRREATESLVERDAEGHHGQRAGHPGEKGHAARSEPVPEDEEHEAAHRDHEGAQEHAARGRAQARQGVSVVGFLETEILDPAEVVTEGVGNLLEHDDEADAREHALDDGIGDVVADGPGADHPEHDLHQAGENDGGQEGLVALQRVDGGGHDHRESRGWPAHAHGRVGQQAHHAPADDARDDAGEERGVRGEGHAQAERQGHEEDDEARGQILSQHGTFVTDVLPGERARTSYSRGPRALTRLPSARSIRARGRH